MATKNTLERRVPVAIVKPKIRDVLVLDDDDESIVPRPSRSVWAPAVVDTDDAQIEPNDGITYVSDPANEQKVPEKAGQAGVNELMCTRDWCRPKPP
jgi:hypothetical protein